MPTMLSVLARSNAVASINVPRRPVSSKRSFFKLVTDTINNIRKKRNRIAPFTTAENKMIINVAAADVKNDGRDFFTSSKTNAQVSLNPVEDQSTIRVVDYVPSGYTDISEFGMIDETIVDEFNELCSRLRREPTSRDSLNSTMLEEPEPVTPEICEVYIKRKEWSRKVIGDAIADVIQLHLNIEPNNERLDN